MENTINTIIFLFFVCISLHKTCALWVDIPKPQFGSITLCASFICFRDTVNHAITHNELLVTLIVTDYNADPYIPLYLGNVLQLFEGDAQRPLSLLLMEPKVFLTDENINEIKPPYQYFTVAASHKR